MALELLAEHIILRRGLIAGHRYPTAARSVGEYIARRAFATSVLAEPFERVNERLAAFSRNHALLRITVDLIFTHPYVVNERNRWTTPQLDDVVAAIRADAELKTAVARLGHRFLTVQEGTPTRRPPYRVRYGDGNRHTRDRCGIRYVRADRLRSRTVYRQLLMAYFSQPGQESSPGERFEHGEWILGQIGEFWHEFVATFDALWSAPRVGDGYPSSFFTSPSETQAFAREREQWFGGLFADTLGYAGAEMIRRIVGFAHNLDFESIANPDLRGSLEQRTLAFARKLIVAPEDFHTMTAVLSGARKQL